MSIIERNMEIMRISVPLLLLLRVTNKSYDEKKVCS